MQNLERIAIENLERIEIEKQEKKKKNSQFNKQIIYYSKRNTLTIFFKICLSINKASKKKKKVSERCITITEILKDVMIKEEIDEKVDAYEKHLRSKHMKLMN